MRRTFSTAVLTGLVLLVVAAAALGAEPTSPPIEVLEGGDLRSEGEGPGLVGNPLLIFIAVVGLGFATAGVTALLARAYDRR